MKRMRNLVISFIFYIIVDDSDDDEQKSRLLQAKREDMSDESQDEVKEQVSLSSRKLRIIESDSD